MNGLLECRGLQKSFGGFVATRGINLAVNHGEFVGVIGANGAGKTTLLNLISGYLTPTAGQVFFQGADVTGVAPRALVKRGIARSFQIPQLFSRSTVRENMMLSLSLLTGSRAAMLTRFDDASLRDAADDILRSYGLSGHADLLISQLPQGIRKLLDIAMATCADPKLVLLDEPTSGVSSEEKNDLMRDLASRFTASKTTVVFIEHDMEVVEKYASRVVALYDGSVISEGAPSTVFADEKVIELITGNRRS